jgi:glyoxylase I family protein
VSGRPLHHIALGTPRVELLAEFYEKGVGLERLKVHYENDGREVRSIWLSSNSVVLMIERTDSAERVEAAPLVPGWATLVFGGAFDSSDEERIRSCGGTVDGQTDYTLYFRDPDGNRFGLSRYQFVGLS